MADTKVSALTALTGANVTTSTDVLPIVDTSAGQSKKILVDELLIALGTTTGTQASTFTWNGSGGSTGSITMTYVKIGNWVSLNIPTLSATTGTGSTGLVSDTALPAAVRPASIQACPVNCILNNGSGLVTAGILLVGTGGILTLEQGITGAVFTNSAAAGTTSNFNVTYFIG